MAYEKKPFEDYKAGDIIEIRGKRYEVALKTVTRKILPDGHKATYKKIYFRALDSIGNRVAYMYSNNIITFHKKPFWGRGSDYYESWREDDLKYLVDKIESKNGKEIDKKLKEGYNYFRRVNH